MTPKRMIACCVVALAFLTSALVGSGSAGKLSAFDAPPCSAMTRTIARQRPRPAPGGVIRQNACRDRRRMPGPLSETRIRAKHFRVVAGLDDDAGG